MLFPDSINEQTASVGSAQKNPYMILLVVLRCDLPVLEKLFTFPEIKHLSNHRKVEHSNSSHSIYLWQEFTPKNFTALKETMQLLEIGLVEHGVRYHFTKGLAVHSVGPLIFNLLKVGENPFEILNNNNMT